MRVVVLFLLGLISVAHVNGQASQKAIDSMIALLPGVKAEDKVDLLNEIGWDIAYVDFKKGLTYSFEALALAKKIKYNHGLVKAYNTIGSTYSDMGIYDEALVYFQEALEVVKKDKKLRMFKGVILFNLSRIYAFREDHANALRYTREAYSILMEKKDSSAMIMIGSVLAGIYSNLGQEDSAAYYFNQSLAVAEKSKDPYKLAIAHMQNGSHLITSKKYDEAFAEFKVAEKFMRQLDDGYDLFAVYAYYATICMKTKKTEQAVEYIKTALREFGKNTTLSSQRDVYAQLSECYNQLGRYKDAFESQSMFVQLNDSINSERNENQLKATEAKFLTEKNQLALDKLKMKNALQKTVIDKQKLYNVLAITGLVALLVVAALIYRGYKNKKKDNSIIILQKQLVEEKNKEILDSITYAKRIQNAILPSPQLMQQYLGENFVLYQPKDIVAGDFYWIDSVNDLIMFAVCDCTGHGVPGALVSVVCHNALNRSIREYGLTDPGKILDKTRTLVVEQFQKSTDHVKDGMDVSLCVLNPATGKLIWSGANIPLWIARNNQTEMEEYKATKQPIGYVDQPVPFVSFTIDIQKGDTLYLFSDGYADQFGGEGGKKLKAANLKKMLLSLKNKPMPVQLETLSIELEKWKGNLEQVDDICMVGLRFS